MSLIDVRNLSFYYEGSYDYIFENVNLRIDTCWRLGLVGRNGRGKTTFLNLLRGKMKYQGEIITDTVFDYFPFEVPWPEKSVMDVISDVDADGEFWKVCREMTQIGLDMDILEHSFQTLSYGERTKVLLAILFARENHFLLIDEPTNHLDVHGRELVARYLRRKDGFLLVSHDRAFLNSCVDHVLALNRSDAWVMQGDYDAWQERFDQQNAWEEARNEDLKRDIVRLEASARRAARWSDRCEKGKFHVAPSETAAVDRGYVGARSAALMKRSANTQRRRERAVEERRGLLHNVERVGELRLTVLRHPKETLVRVEEGVVRYDGRVVCEGLRFDIRRGDRVALTGPNGAGKSSVLRALCGAGGALEGKVSLASGLVVSYVPQEAEGLCGGMRDFIQRNGLDETLFKAILRNMDMSREHFDQDLSELSQGQKKKLLLARSLCTPAHLYLWDEPLNYIDVLSRRQVENLILRYAPTLLVVEHDARFLETVCTREAIRLQPAS